MGERVGDGDRPVLGVRRENALLPRAIVGRLSFSGTHPVNVTSRRPQRGGEPAHLRQVAAVIEADDPQFPASGKCSRTLRHAFKRMSTPFWGGCAREVEKAAQGWLPTGATLCSSPSRSGYPRRSERWRSEPSVRAPDELALHRGSGVQTRGLDQVPPLAAEPEQLTVAVIVPGPSDRACLAARPEVRRLRAAHGSGGIDAGQHDQRL